jgi:hypothetical protein
MLLTISSFPMFFKSFYTVLQQWFRQQRHKRNASIRTVVKNEIDGCGEPAHSYSTRSRDASNQLEDSGISSASGTGSRSNFPRATSRVVTSPHYSQQINNVKLENIDVGNSHNTANNTQLSWIKTEPHLSKNLKEPSEYQRTYLNRSSRRGFASKCDQVKTEPVSPTKVSVKQEKVEKRYYFKTNVEIPAILCERFYAIRELGLPLFRKKINQLCLNFEELVEFYITCDEESQKVIREESQLLSGIIEFHEQSGLAFTADQEDYMVERGLQILNKLLRSRPSDKNWCAAVNNFHVENVFRSWHFVAVYAYLSQVSMVDGITDFCSKLHVSKTNIQQADTYAVLVLLLLTFTFYFKGAQRSSVSETVAYSSSTSDDSTVVSNQNVSKEEKYVFTSSYEILLKKIIFVLNQDQVNLSKVLLSYVSTNR